MFHTERVYTVVLRIVLGAYKLRHFYILIVTTYSFDGRTSKQFVLLMIMSSISTLVTTS